MERRTQCCASYHHFASIDDITHVLASFLRPGGSLLVSDMRAEEDARDIIPASHHAMVSHKHGIEEAQLRAAFEGAGLQEFEARDAGREKMQLPKGAETTNMEATWFIARGVKPQ